jgi:chemotaxis signal transduction protein
VSQERDASTLREEFDRAFTEPARAGGEPEIGLLALRAGGEPLLVRVLEAAGLLPARPVVPVPGRRPELLGVVGVRGAVVPVFSVARLLGRADAGAPAWLVLAGGAERVALAFEAFEGHVVAAPGDVRPLADPAPHLAGAVRVGRDARPLLAIPSLLNVLLRSSVEPKR